MSQKRVNAEDLMAQVRMLLGQAHLCERRGEIERADAYGARAGNKTAHWLRVTLPPLVPKFRRPA